MYDLVLLNATIVDGSGGPWYVSDLAVTNGRITGIGKLRPEQAKQVLDVTGKIVTPGFIDPHTHSDMTALGVNNPEAKITQGVTTEIVGNCGLSQFPVDKKNLPLLKQYLAPFTPASISLDWDWSTFSDWKEKLNTLGHMTDLGCLVGHGTLRIAVMGFDDRKPEASELDEMKKLLERDLESGAMGLSTGLVYPPGCYSDTEEIIELCKIVAEKGGIYSTHLRSESTEEIEAMEEAINIGRKSGCAVHISHHKIISSFEGLSQKTLSMMESARKEGIDVTCDVYPYTAGSTLISALLPKWANVGGVAVMLKRLEDPETRFKICSEFSQDIPGWENFAKAAGWENILICSVSNDKSLEGMTLQEIAEKKSKKPEEAVLDTILSEKGEVTIALFSQSEKDLREIIYSDLSMIGSDSLPCSFSGKLASGKPHPRSFATYPRVLAKFVKEENTISLEKAIWKMTGFPAQRFGLADRGILKEDLIADLVVLDIDKIKDNATFQNPFQQADGIEYVFKNGKVVVENKEVKEMTLGKIVC